MTNVYLIALIVIGLAFAAAGLTFHYFRPGGHRSIEGSVAIFGAILATAAFVDGLLDKSQQASEREAQVIAAQNFLNHAIATADRQAANRDELLADKIDQSLAKVGAPKIVQTMSRTGDTPDTIRKITQLETEKRLRDEFAAYQAKLAKAESDSAMRQLCQMDSYKDSKGCEPYR